MTEEQQRRIDFDHGIMAALSDMSEYVVIGTLSDGTPCVLPTSWAAVPKFLSIGNDLIEAGFGQAGGPLP